MKKYIEREGRTLKIEVTYNKGGQNNWTGRNEKRGYYLHVTPVKLKQYSDGITMELTTAFSGYKELLKEVGRQSDKALAEAEKIAEQVVEELIEAVLRKGA